MFKRLNRKKGIVLVTTMLSVVIVFMLMSGLVYSNLGSMRMTNDFYDREIAAMAAESGISYALTRLQSNVNWKGCGPSLPVTNNLQVSEKNGNVIGIMELNGRRAVFRIKFNYEDGDSGLDGLKNSDNPIRSPYVSVNNLSSSKPVTAYSADSDGTLEVEAKKVGSEMVYTPKKAEGTHIIPKFTCNIVCEGFCGPATRNASLKNPISSSLKCSKKVAEIYCETDIAASGYDTLISASGDFKEVSTYFVSDAVKGADAPLMRGLKDVNLNSSAYNFNKASIYYGKNITKKLKNYGTNSSFSLIKSTDDSNVCRISWDNIAKVDKTNAAKIINSGTYAWCRKNGNNVLVCCDGYYPEGTAIPKDVLDNAPEVSSSQGFIVEPGTLTVMLDSNTYIDGDGRSTKNFVVRSCIDEYGTRPIIGFVGADESDTMGIILSSAGDVCIYGSVLGKGSVTSEGNLVMQGPSVLESDPGVGVSFYAKGDVTITGINNTTQKSESKNNKRGDKKRNSNKAPTADSSAVINDDTSIADFIEIDQSAVASDAEAWVKKIKWASKGNNKWEGCWYLSDDNEGKCGDQSIYGFNPYHKNAIESKVRELYTNAASYGKLEPANIRCGFCAGDHGLYQGVYGEYSKYSVGELNNDCPVAKFFNQIAEAGREYFMQNFEGVDPNKASAEEPDININQVETAAEFVDERFVSKNYKEYKTEQLKNLLAKYRTINYSDQDISGVIYAWGNIKFNVGPNSKINVTGTMIAYGGDPGIDDPGKGKDSKGKNMNGNIELIGQTITLTSNPNYLNNILNNKVNRPLTKKMYAIY